MRHPRLVLLGLLSAILLLAPLAMGSASQGGPPARVAALERTVATLSVALDNARPDTLPAGAIVAWSGLPGMLPEGWVLCDGENGTPDLRGRFIVGAVVGAGEQGGAETHEHEMDPHVHAAVLAHTHADNPIRVRTSTDPSYDTGHFHRSVWSASGSVPTGTRLSGVAVADWLHSHFDPSDPTMIHEHELRFVEAVTPAGTDLEAEIAEAASEVTAAENVPPYYKAAFVMKLP